MHIPYTNEDGEILITRSGYYDFVPDGPTLDAALRDGWRIIYEGWDFRLTCVARLFLGAWRFTYSCIIVTAKGFCLCWAISVAAIVRTARRLSSTK